MATLVYTGTEPVVVPPLLRRYTRESLLRPGDTLEVPDEDAEKLPFRVAMPNRLRVV